MEISHGDMGTYLDDKLISIDAKDFYLFIYLFIFLKKDTVGSYVVTRLN